MIGHILTVQNKKYVTVAHIDFSREFDSVSHEKLLVRPYSYFIYYRTRTRSTLEHTIKQKKEKNTEMYALMAILTQK